MLQEPYPTASYRIVGGRGGGGGGRGAGAGAGDAVEGPEGAAGDPEPVGNVGVDGCAGTLGETAAPEITAGGVYGAARRIDGSGKSDGVLRPKLRNTSLADSEINTSL